MLESAVPEFVINELINKARTSPEGCFVEIGVYKGGTAYHLSKLAEEQNRQIYLYDTFEGIPYRSDMDFHYAGDFGDADYETVKNAIPYATVVKGVFPNSAVEMPPIAFLHLDCDQYQSVIDSVNYLLPKMVKGGIIWFDDAAPNMNVEKGKVNGAHWAMLELFDGKYQVDKNSNKAFVVV